jgi:hypothetical protein
VHNEGVPGSEGLCSVRGVKMIPDPLYKYVGPDRIDVLAKKRIRFTQPCFLNDPFEFRPAMPVAGAEDLGHFEAKIAKQRDALYDEKSRLCAILSLAQRNDSIPMWAHYADSHRGFVIAFGTGTSFLKDPIETGKLQRVRYQPKRVSLTRGLPGQPWVPPDAIFRTKSTDWEYEQEWRWLESGSPCSWAQVVEAPSGDLFPRPTPPESIRQIILGHRADSSLINSIMALKSTSDYDHLQLFRIALKESYYKLDIEPL